VLPGERHGVSNPFSGAGRTADRGGDSEDDEFEAASFEEAMQALFPCSLPSADMLESTHQMLAQRGFTDKVPVTGCPT
jgi:hypothetical protein